MLAGNFTKDAHGRRAWKEGVESMTGRPDTRRPKLPAEISGPHRKNVRALVAAFRKAVRPLSNASKTLDSIDEMIGSLQLLAAALRKQMDAGAVKKTDYMRFTVLLRETSARFRTLEGTVGLIEDSPDPFPALEKRVDDLYTGVCTPPSSGGFIYMDLARDARALKDEFQDAREEWAGLHEDLLQDMDGASLVLDDLGLVVEKARQHLAARGDVKPAASKASGRKKPARMENRFLK